MRVVNDNTVLVKLNVSTPSHTLSVPGNGVVYVPPQGKTNVKVTLKTQLLGKFNGLLRYVVNDSHAFEAPVTADVVLRTLQLPDAEQHFGFVHGFEEAWPKITHVIPIKNPLQVSCRFEWTAIDKTCYDVLPRFGTAIANGAQDDCVSDSTFFV
ncbi:hypothetical protein R5R35_009298 [Gryllus longicercus]|uniref:Uncharacterized protein n=1 Tax=Gryllus longicercus TaxID=2509291 RepID=A0AAN9W054_9ORTH